MKKLEERTSSVYLCYLYSENTVWSRVANEFAEIGLPICTYHHDNIPEHLHTFYVSVTGDFSYYFGFQTVPSLRKVLLVRKFHSVKYIVKAILLAQNTNDHSKTSRNDTTSNR